MFVVDVRPRHVRGQEVRRELDAGEGESQRLRQHASQHSLPGAGDVLDEDVAAGDDGGQRLVEDGFLDDDGLLDAADDVLTPLCGLRDRQGDGALAHGRCLAFR